MRWAVRAVCMGKIRNYNKILAEKYFRKFVKFCLSVQHPRTEVSWEEI
jgi:hypothetical protein